MRPRPSSKSQLDTLQVGDTVCRWLAGTLPMLLKVSQIDELIHCGPWTFHRDTGAEVDLELGWDGVTTTGSFLQVLVPDFVDTDVVESARNYFEHGLPPGSCTMHMIKGDLPGAARHCHPVALAALPNTYLAVRQLVPNDKP